MALRRAFFAWQFAAAAVLPLWLLLGYAIGGAPLGSLLGVVLLAPLVLVVELGLALLFSARAGIRRSRALDLPAVGVLTAYQVGVIGLGFFGPTAAWFGLLAAAAAIGGFWLGGTLLVHDVRRRVERALAAAQSTHTVSGPSIDAGEYIVITPSGR